MQSEYEKILSRIQEELMSGMSALNMYPTEKTIDDKKYFSDQFEMVRHSYNHLQSAFKLLSELSNLKLAGKIRMLQAFCEDNPKIDADEFNRYFQRCGLDTLVEEK